MQPKVISKYEIQPGDELGDGSEVEAVLANGKGEVFALLEGGGARELPPEVIVRRSPSAEPS